MLKPLVKRCLFLAFLALKRGRWTFLGISPPRNQLTPKHVFGCKEPPANPYRISWRSVQETKKSRKSTLGLNISPHPQTTPFTYTFRFVLVGWGHRRNHPCQVSSQSVQQFGLPRGSKFTISHRLGEWLLQQCYALTCYTVRG